MTIGEKLTYLRTQKHMSQEMLAEKLSVSRQSVSKWEMDQAQPQLDKVVNICKLFEIGADDFLNDELNLEIKEPPKGNKYFGTDGFRGEANVGLTAEHAFKIGRFLGWYYASPLSGCQTPGYCPRIVIGKDTRRSSYMLEYALVAGIVSSGAEANMLHVITTPGVSFITKQDGFDCGIMITASHNPFYDNGIKIINRFGEKLDDKTTSYIEAYIDGDMNALGIVGQDLPLAQKENIGQTTDYVAGRNRYVGYLISLASHSYRHLRIGLDCANGASWMIAKSVFDALGAQTFVMGNHPNGTNVNLGVGSTHIEALCEFVRENHLDVGYAFDGDADRCIAVDENGNVVDGDKIIYILGTRFKRRGMLNKDTVVTTIMSNSGLNVALEKEGISNEQTTVGDRFVYERMQERNYSIGGEQSGHVIIKKYATTGDGLLTAIMLTEEICDEKATMSKLAEPVVLFPQMIKNVKVLDKPTVMKDEKVLAAVDKVNRLIDGHGRALLRQSGTEPVVRIMVEAVTEADCNEYIDMIYKVIAENGYVQG